MSFVTVFGSIQKVDVVYFLGAFPQIAAAVLLGALLVRHGVRRLRRAKHGAAFGEASGLT